jgi:hypothetical protein
MTDYADNAVAVLISDLSGRALDYAVAKYEGEEYPYRDYSTNWSLAGPIVEREGIEIVRGNDLIFPKGNEKGELCEKLWLASCRGGRKFHGQTQTIAAMRCYVSSKAEGDSVMIPKELL